MERHPIVLFGEAERGEYRRAYYCHTLPQLVESLGNPPEDSRGLFYAIQALLYQYDLLFFRVREEGYSLQDYMYGFHLLERKDLVEEILAICLPGVGDNKIINAVVPVCENYNSVVITSEADLFDYLTSQKTDRSDE